MADHKDTSTDEPKDKEDSSEVVSDGLELSEGGDKSMVEVPEEHEQKAFVGVISNSAPEKTVENDESTSSENPVDHDDGGIVTLSESLDIDTDKNHVEEDKPSDRPEGVGPHPNYDAFDEPGLLGHLIETVKAFQLKTTVALVLSLLMILFTFTWVNLEWAIMLPMGAAAAYLLYRQREETEGLEHHFCRYGFYVVLAVLLLRDIGLTQDLTVYKQAHSSAKKLRLKATK